jgi:NADH-quinone oxidoreductase subunit K
MLLITIKLITLSYRLFFIGFCGIYIGKKNILVILISIELILLGANLNFVFNSIFLEDILGQLYSLCILCVAGAESAIGLGLLIVFFKVKHSTSLASMNTIHG